jgi:uncharacterized protein
MIRFVRLSALPVAALMLALAGCASSPTHFHTLVAPAPEQVPGTAVPAAPFAIEVLPVSVPAQVDQPQLVLRDGQSGILVLDGERWIAPLGDEVRSALVEDLTETLKTHDVYGLPHAADSRIMRIKLDVRRFDSQLDGYALIDAGWTVRAVGGKDDAVLACSSRVREPVGHDYPDLVRGHQRALAQVAGQIATAARSVAAGAPACP